MYLTVAGIVRVLTSTDAAGIAPDSSTAHASAAAASNPAVGAAIRLPVTTASHQRMATRFTARKDRHQSFPMRWLFVPALRHFVLLAAANCPRARPAIKGAAVLLATYIAMFLAITGISHVLSSPDAAAAIAPNSSTTSRAAVTAWTSPVDVGESPPSDSLGLVSEQTDNSREGKSSTAIESN
jgi:hypothetical protein